MNEKQNVSYFKERKVLNIIFFSNNKTEIKVGQKNSCRRRGSSTRPTTILKVNLELGLGLRLEVSLKVFRFLNRTLASFCKESKFTFESDKYYIKFRNICKECLNRKMKGDFCEKKSTRKRMPTHIKRNHNNKPASNNRILTVVPFLLVKLMFQRKKLKKHYSKRFTYNH